MASSTTNSEQQPSATTSRWQPQKISWWYDAILDLMLLHPEWSKKDIAADLKVTPAAIYLITNSDIFKARFAQRREEFNGRLDGSIHARLLAVADKSLAIIGDVLEKKRDSIPLPQLREIAEGALDRLGYGVSKNAPPATTQVNVQVNDSRSVVVPVTPQDLEAARLALRRSEEMKSIESPRLLSGGRLADSVSLVEGEVLLPDEGAE